MPNTLNRPFVVGLTGGIACGKSSICSLFKKLNVPIVDADIVAREVVEVGSPLLKPVFDSYTQIKTAQSIDTTGVALF